MSCETASSMAEEAMNIVTETRKARENGVYAAIAWGSSSALIFLAVYTPVHKVKFISMMLLMFGACGVLGGAWLTAIDLKKKIF
jgi:hypothetical protein